MEEKNQSMTTVHLDSPRQISAAHRPLGEVENNVVDEEVCSDDGFEFAFVPRDGAPGAESSADEIFSNGRIRPAYLVFGRDLFHEDEVVDEEVRVQPAKLAIGERDEGAASASSESDELEGVTEGSYCAWAPQSVPQSPERWRKSSSTGSAGRRWRLRDLLIGRSHSDGKERFVFLGSPERDNAPKANPKPNGKAKAGEAEKKKKKTTVGKVTETGAVTAYRAYYAAKEQQGVKGGRRSFLPYRPELVGFFGNAGGTLHPF